MINSTIDKMKLLKLKVKEAEFYRYYRNCYIYDNSTSFKVI